MGLSGESEDDNGEDDFVVVILLFFGGCDVVDDLKRLDAWEVHRSSVVVLPGREGLLSVSELKSRDLFCEEVSWLAVVKNWGVGSALTGELLLLFAR